VAAYTRHVTALSRAWHFDRGRYNDVHMHELWYIDDGRCCDGGTEHESSSSSFVVVVVASRLSLALLSPVSRHLIAAPAASAAAAAADAVSVDSVGASDGAAHTHTHTQSVAALQIDMCIDLVIALRYVRRRPAPADRRPTLSTDVGPCLCRSTNALAARRDAQTREIKCTSLCRPSF